MAVGVSRGLLYLHSFDPPLIHRDLKVCAHKCFAHELLELFVTVVGVTLQSANVLVFEGLQVKISDFGLARVQSLAQTMTGSCGTTHWMAPEVLAGNRYTVKADGGYRCLALPAAANVQVPLCYSL